MEGHPYAMRLTPEEKNLVDDLSKKNVKPHDILSTIKEQNVNNCSSLKTIYNAREKLKMIEKQGLTEMQVFIALLHKKGFIFEHRVNENNVLEDFFFAHPLSLELWHAFPQVLLLDATYRTNRFNMPFLEIVSVTSTNLTFCVAFAFLCKEMKDNYEWVLNCLKSTLDERVCPRVIVTDRAYALMNACETVFPYAKQLLCRWHISQSVFKYGRPSMKSPELWNSLDTAWKSLVLSSTVTSYLRNYARLEALLTQHPGVLEKLNRYWLVPHKEMFVSAWTDKFRNFGNHTTNRVESQHAKYKLYLDSSQSSLDRCVYFLNELVHSQQTAIKESLTNSEIARKHRDNIPEFQQLWGVVSQHALDIIFTELERSKRVNIASGNCGCLLRTSCGLPCAHEIAIFVNAGQPIPLESIDVFWKKLDLSPSIFLNDDDLCCDNDLEKFKESFNKQSIFGKSNYLKKIRGIFNPSIT